MKDQHPAEAPVAWAIELEDGTIGGFGWASMDTFATVQAIATLREGARYVFAYREADGANERAQLLFDAKNHWADQARAAATTLARVRALADEWERFAELCERKTDRGNFLSCADELRAVIGGDHAA